MRRHMLLMFAVVTSIAECSEDEKSKKEHQTVYSKESQNGRENLQRILNGSYDKNVRPFIAVKALVIHVQIGISSISQISEENMEFQCTMYFRQSWHDPRLAYGDDNTTIILEGENLEKIWLPDTYIDNARKTTVDRRTTGALLFANGTVFYSYRLTSTLGVSMDFLNYPMDEQKLYISIVSYLHDETKIVLKWKGGSILNQELATYVLHRDKLLRRSELFLTGSYSFLLFEFEVHRRLGYFLMQFYFPCVLSVFVSWLPFWMDRYEIGDRVSLGITTLLTEVFLSQYINSAMPRVSYIKAADEFLLSSFVFIMMALIESVVVYNVREDVRKRKSQHLSRRKKSQVLRNGSTKELDDFKKRSTKEFNDEECNNVITKEYDNPAFDNETPFSIVNVLRANFKPDKAKSEDLGRKVDNISRVVFPLTYLLFVSYYFGRYALYNRLM